MANQTFTVNQTTSLLNDVDGDGLIDPGALGVGDTVRTTVTIQNNSTNTDATGVTFAETLAGMTLVNQTGNDINVSPLAFNEAYTAIGNTLLEVGNATSQTAPQSNIAGHVTDNDVEFFGDTFVISAVNATAVAGATTTITTANGGTVVMVTDASADRGSFTYISAANFTGTDTFTYTIRDKGLDGIAGNADDLTGVGTVTITVANQVWYVDNTAGTGGDGTSTNPFDSLADVSGASGPDTAGDIIYVNTGSGDYTGGITLLTNQELHGEGTALIVGGFTLATAGTDPTIANAAGDGVTLATGNTLTGFTVGNTTGYDIANTITASVGTLTISNVTLNGSGGLIRVDSGGTLTVQLDSATTSDAGAKGIFLQNVDNSTFTVSGVTTINDADQDGINITNSQNSTFTFTGKTTILNDAAGADGDGVDLQNNNTTDSTFNFNGGVDITVNGTDAFGLRATSSGTVNVLNPNSDNQITSNNGTAIFINPTAFNANLTTVTAGNGGTGDGIHLDGVSGTGVTIGTVNVSGSGDDGIQISNSSAAITINGGSVSGTTGTGFQVGADANTANSGGTGAITYSGTVTTTGSARAVDIEDRAAGAGNITLSGTVSHASGNAATIFVDGNAAGTITFSGANSVANSGTSDAISLTNNTGATINFTGGGLNIDTTSATGFHAAGGGTVSVTGTGNVIDATSGAGLIIANTNIGASDITFQHITAGTGAGSAGVGISLDTTGSAGGLHVTGTGTADTGGTIQHKTGADGSTTAGIGIYLNSTTDVQLNSMQLNDFDNNAIRGATINGLVLNDMDITGTNGTIAGANQEYSVYLVNATGTVNILGTEISGGYNGNIAIDNSSGTTNLNFLNNTIQNTNDAFTGDGFNLEADTTAIVLANISNNTFTNNDGDNFNLSLINNAQVDLTFNNNDLNGGTGKLGAGIFILGASFDGTLEYDISNNSVDGSNQGGAIQVNKGSGTATFSGQIINNTIGTSGVTLSGALQSSGIIIGARGLGGSHTVKIDGNTVLQYDDRGIVLEAGGGTAALTAQVTNNTVSEFGSAVDSLHGIHVDAGFSDGGNPGNNNVTLDIRANNVATAGNEAAGGKDIRIFIASPADAFFVGASTVTDAASAQTYVDGQNPTATTIQVSGSGTFNNGPASLPTPNLPELPPAPLLASSTGGVDAAPADTPQWQIVGIGDFNGDGLADGLALRSDGLVGFGTINGDPAQSHILGQLGAEWQIVGIGDVDNDGTSDILLRNDDGTYQAELIQNNTVAATVDLVLVDGELRIPSSDPQDTTGGSGAGDAPPATPPANPVFVDDGFLSQPELDALVAAATLRWAAAGLSAEQMDALAHLTFTVGDLSGQNLGAYTPGHVTLDADAAGRSWYVDATPLDDSEFGHTITATQLQTDPTATPAGRYDALTTVMHEMGHALGLADDYDAGARDDLMYGWLFAGERRLPGVGEADGAVAGSITDEAFAGSLIQVLPADATGGVFTLPFGKTVTIQWDATIDQQTNQLILNPVNTGMVTATNPPADFPDTNTNTVTTTLDTLILGGTIWNDNGAGGGIAGNGIKDGTEAGVAGVTLSLFVDANNDDAPDTPGTPLVTGVLTNGSGDYSFTGLAPGNYIVRVDQDNFDAGGNVSLLTLQISPVTSPDYPDPDDNVDNDDNGGPHTPGTASFSKAITLAYNTEPTAGTGNDTNTTLDFGFMNNPPPVIHDLGGDTSTFTEDGPAVLLDDSSAPEVAATVTDDQTNFNGGNLTVSTTVNEVAAEDVLGISTAGTVTLSSGTNVGSVVSVGGLAIGTVTSNGTGGNDLVVTFNTTDATPANVSALVQSLTYSNSNTANPSTLQRTISVSVNDGLTGVDSENVLVNVTATNDAPVLITSATPVLGAVNEDAAAPGVGSGTLVSSLVDLNPPAGGNDNVTDPDGAGALTGIALTNVVTTNGSWFYTIDGGANWLAVGAVTDDSARLLAADANTRLYFQPTTADFNGLITDAITFRAWDQTSGTNGTLADPTPAGGSTAFSTDSDTANITVSAVADIVDDSVTVGEDSGANTLNLLANDSFENVNRAITAVGAALHGTTAINDNGTAGDPTDDFVTYTPSADYNGSDTFTYTVTSGGATETATVNVTVSAVADIADDSVTVGEDSGANTLNLLANDSFENANRAITAVGAALHGTTAINNNGTAGDPTDDFVTYTPSADYNGSDTFTYTVTSGGATETATVNVTVSAVADIADDSVTVGEDSGANTLNLLANDSFENANRAITAVGAALHGTTAINNNGTAGDPTDDFVTYTPSADYNGSDTFTYTVTSNGTTETATVNVTVSAVADIVDDSVTVGEDSGTNTLNLLANDSFENANRAISGVGVAAHGTTAINNNGTAGDPTDDFVTYTPSADYNGSDTFTYTVTSGGATETATVNVTVSAVADIVDDSVTVGEDSGANTLNLLANDSFENANRAITAVGAALHGTTAINNNGTAGDPTDDFVTYTPSADYNGSDTFTYTVTSGGATETATVNVTVSAVADIADDSVTVGEDSGANTLNLLANDSFENANRAITAVGAALHGTTAINNNGTAGDPTDDFVTYTPSADYNGADSFTYTVTSGGVTETATVNVTINAVADIVNDTASTNEDNAVNILVQGNDTFENPTHAITGTTNGANGTVSVNNNGTAGDTTDDFVVYTPNLNFNGGDSFTYTVTSNGTTETATVNVTVNAVNDVPQLTGFGDVTAMVENGAGVTLDANANASVSDVELNGSGSNYAGATLTLARNGGANPDDTFTGTGSLDLSDSNGLGENVSLDGGATFIGTFSQPGDGTFSIAFNANATAANVNSVMRQIVYTNAGENPPASLQIDFTFSDGNGQPGGQPQGSGATPGTATGSFTVNITQVDDAPFLLSVAVGASYTPGSSGAVLSPALIAGDPDAVPPSPLIGLVSATVKIESGFFAGDQLFVNLPTSGGFFIVDEGGGPVVTNISVASNVAGTMVLSGQDSTTRYQLVLDAVNYRSTAVDPSNGGANPTRTITWQVNDGALNSQTPNTDPNNLVNATILHFNVPPTVDLDASGAGTGFTTTFTERDAPLRFVDTDMTITDPDNTFMSSAKIVLTNAKVSDALSIAGALPGGIDSSIDTSVPGQITVSLVNSASIADYQTAIGQIRFSNSSIVPDTTDRDITVTVNDNDSTSNVAHATVHVVDVPTRGTDFNADGKADIFWQVDSGQLALWEMNGFQISFADYLRLGASPVGLPGADWHVIDTSDVNGDGKTDILWRTDAGKLALWEMDGNHILAADFLRIGGTAINAPGADWHALGSVDADGDGKGDILWRTDGGQLAIWELDGFQIKFADYLRSGSNPVNVPAAGWQIVGTGDFDGDGKGGILWRAGNGVLATWELNGNQIKSADFIKSGPAQVGAPGADWHVVDVADFDGDGKSDILWRTGPPTPPAGPQGGMEPGGGQIAIWEMNGSQIKAADYTRVGATAVGAPGNDWHVLGADDYDGDGKADILWRTDSGALAIWEMDGTHVAAADYTRIGATAVGAPGADWHVYEHRYDLV
jgi:hypothetical protein